VPAPAAAGPATPLDAEGTALLTKARGLYQRQKLADASAALAELLARAPRNPDALLLQAQVQLEQGALDDALGTAQRCVTIDESLADCWLTLGVLQQNRKANGPARVAYERYLELAPSGQYAKDAKVQLRRLP
jgi:tetratricopeptide (TPR) repeat protein